MNLLDKLITDTGRYNYRLPIRILNLVSIKQQKLLILLMRKILMIQQMSIFS